MPVKGLMVSTMANIADNVGSSKKQGNEGNNKTAKAVKTVKAYESVNTESTESTPKFSSKLSSSSPSSPSITWPVWMQKAMMEDGRVAFQGCKIGIRIGRLHNKPCSLTEMLRVIETYRGGLRPEQVDFQRKPTPSYLRRHCVCIAIYRSEEASRIDCNFSIVLYDNGWFEYWGTGRRTTLYLPDCIEFVYRYNLVIDEVDEFTVEQSVLGNTDWHTVAALFAEERITQNMTGYNAGNTCYYTDEELPFFERKQVTEIVGAAHIPTPEERLLKQERRAEMGKIIAKATARLTDKQAEIYKLHFEYDYSLESISEMLKMPRTTASSRLMGTRAIFSRELKKQTGEDAREYFNDNSNENSTESVKAVKAVKAKSSDDIKDNGSKETKGASGASCNSCDDDDDDNFSYDDFGYESKETDENAED